MSQADGDSTPRTGSRKITEEYSAVDLLREQVKDLAKDIRVLSATLGTFRDAVSEIRSMVAVNTERFSNHAEKIRDLERTRTWAFMGIIAAIGSLTLQALSHLFGQNK